MNVLRHMWQFQWYRNGLFDWCIISSKRTNGVPGSDGLFDWCIFPVKGQTEYLEYKIDD